MSKVIVFGGTFDPVHNGHLSIARQAREQTAADEVWFVVTNVPPLRDAAHAPPQARLEMVRAAVEGEEAFRAMDLEQRRGGVSHTADTMDALHTAEPSPDFALLLGADVARSMPRWHRAAELLARERFIIVNRAGHGAPGDGELRSLGYDRRRLTRLDVESPDVSGSEIRRRIAAGEDVSGMVPAAVLEVIQRRGLYRKGSPVHNAGG